MLHRNKNLANNDDFFMEGVPLKASGGSGRSDNFGQRPPPTLRKTYKLYTNYVSMSLMC